MIYLNQKNLKNILHQTNAGATPECESTYSGSLLALIYENMMNEIVALRLNDWFHLAEQSD